MERDTLVLKTDSFKTLSLKETQGIDGGALPALPAIPFGVKLAVAVVGSMLAGVGVGYAVNK